MSDKKWLQDVITKEVEKVIKYSGLTSNDIAAIKDNQDEFQERIRHMTNFLLLRFSAKDTIRLEDKEEKENVEAEEDMKSLILPVMEIFN